jgi:hypothetical protein
VQARRRVIADPAGAGGASLDDRVARLDWTSIEARLDADGFATTGPLLTPAECDELIALWGDGSRFRSHIDMARYRFGEGAYKYFGEPLPPTVAALRGLLYARLAPVANRWAERLGEKERYPDTLDELRARCARHGQRRPTPLILRYTTGGYNCLHQDIYGAVAFPLQITCLLSEPGEDFTGGQFLLVESRPRQQSRGEAVALARGEAIAFTTRHRPVRGARGWFRATLRHGVSRLWSGERFTLGVIFHDAE